MNRPWSLTRREQFTAVFRQGRAHTGSMVVVRALPNDLGVSRLGVVVSKKVGGAVVRNRAKRRIRAAVNIRALPPGWDVVVIARTSIQSAEYRHLESELRQLLARAGVCAPNCIDRGCRGSSVPEDNL